MGSSYVLYARPLNVQRGNKIRVYLREFRQDRERPERSRGRSFFIDTLVDATIASMELPEATSAKVLKEMNDAAPEGVRFYEQPFDDPKNPIQTVIHAELEDRGKQSRESLDAIARKAGLKGKFFLHKNYSGSRDLRYKFPPFTVPVGFGIHPHSKHEGWVTQAHDELPLETMLAVALNDVHMFFDFETRGWKRAGDREQIVMAVLGTNKEWLPKYLMTKYDLGIAEIGGYKIKVCPTDEQFSKTFRAIVRMYDPLSIGVFNGATFDLRKGRALLPKFHIDVEGGVPKVRSAAGRFYCTQVHGRCVVDAYNKLQPEYPFLVNQRLPALVHYLQAELPPGAKFEKSLNYEQLGKAYDDAERGDPSSLRAAASYTAADGDATAALIFNQLPEVFLHAINLHYRPESICKGFSNIADESWKRAYFSLRRTDLDRRTRTSEYHFGKWVHIPRMNPHKDQRRFFTRDPRIIDGEIALTRKEGAFPDACFVYPTLLLNGAKPLLDASPRLSALREQFRNTPATKRYRGVRRLQEIVVLPVTEYLDVCKQYHLDPATTFPAQVFDGDKRDFRAVNHEFRVAYGNGAVDLRRLNWRFSAIVERWREIFDERGIINHDGQFMLLEPRLAQKLEQEHLCLILGRGPAISYGKRAFLYAPAQDTLYVMRSKLTPGRNAEWERGLIHDVLKEALFTVAESGIINRAIVQDIIDGHVERIPHLDRTTLLLKRTLKSHSLELYGIDEEKDERALRQWYGFAGGRVLPEAEFLGAAASPDAQMYRAHFHQAYRDIMEFLLQPNHATQQALFR